MSIAQSIETMPKRSLFERARLWLAAQALRLVDEPILYTARGNVPIKLCQRVVQWEDREGEMVYTEAYFIDGVQVKKSVDVYLKQGVQLGADQAKF